VKITDAWMAAFLEDPNSPHVVTNPRTQKNYYLPKSLEIWEYDLRSLTPADKADLLTGDFYTRQDMWNIIINNAWRTGEPGVGYIDRINQANPTPQLGRMESTNPCGEQPLLPFEACNLGSINLAQFITQPGTPHVDVDWDAMRETIHDSTRFLDNVIDANRYPLPQIDHICKRNRKIGLGIMGFADALFSLGIGYNTDEGIAWGKRFMKFVDDESHAYSERLASERGCFPNWKGSLWDTVHHRPMRNATCTTVAPTGTISIIAGCSGGIEPLYSLRFVRNVLKGQNEGKPPMIEINPIFEDVARRKGFHSEGMMDRIATEGTLAHIDGLPEDIRRVFVCAHDIQPDWHVKMQAAFQEHCDAAISKTINFPESATVADVEKIYRLAYELRCKGVTVYRNGCRKHQPMSLKQADKNEATSEHTEIRPAPEPRDLLDIASGVRIRQVTPFGNMHVQITTDPKTERELEVFAQLGKGGDLANSDLEAICRLISLWLRSGGAINHVIGQLKGIGSTLQVATKEGKIRSLGDGVARALQKYVRAKTKFGLKNLLLGDFDLADLDSDWATIGRSSPSGNGNGNGRSGNGANRENASVSIAADDYSARGRHMTQEEQFKVSCPDCQYRLSFVEGCVKCEACGFSQC
jgi:ribonucleoside-diphosphate reductase alpha chain